jgi:D-amino-acid dehydrogenase
VIGTTSAWYLARAGHEVVVLDRQAGAGLETSFGNAGEISPGASASWAAPEIPLQALKWLFTRYRPLVIRPRLDPAMLVWGLMMLRNCTAARYELNKARMLPLAEYSRDMLRVLRAEIGIAYDERARGILQLFRSAKELAASAGDVAILQKFGVAFELLDAAACVDVEPALALVREKIAGGLRLPGDETGDCFKFTQALATACREQGVDFRYDTTIERIAADGDRVSGVVTDRGMVTGDAYIVALGSYSLRLLRPIGIRAPIYPVKGYSLTVPITDPAGAPESSVVDETYKVAITRLGDRIRVGGMAELAGYDLELREAPRRTLEHVVCDLFPSGGDLSKASFWCGLRPMTPDGPPLVGPTRYRNLWLNTGHGTLGWIRRVPASITTSRIKPLRPVVRLSLWPYATSRPLRMMSAWGSNRLTSFSLAGTGSPARTRRSVCAMICSIKGR